MAAQAQPPRTTSDQLTLWVTSPQTLDTSPHRMANPTDCFCTFRCTDLQKYVTNATTDVFLASYTALEPAVGLHGLPWVLQPELHDHQTGQGLFELLTEHANAAAAGYDALIARVSCPVAWDLFVKTMCRNYAKRQTPEQALQHPWLADTAAVAQEAAAAVAPLYQQQAQPLVELFSEVPAVIIPQQQQPQKQPCQQGQKKANMQNGDEEDTELNSGNCGAQQTTDASHPDLSCAATTADVPVRATDSSVQEAPSSCSCSSMLLDEDKPAMYWYAGTDSVQSAGKPSVLQQGRTGLLKLFSPGNGKCNMKQLTASRLGKEVMLSVTESVKSHNPDSTASQQAEQIPEQHSSATMVCAGLDATTSKIFGTTGTCLDTNSGNDSYVSPAVRGGVPANSSDSSSSGSGYTSSRSSQSSTGDTAAADQWPPVAIMTASMMTTSSTYSRKSHLLQKGKKLLAKIRSKRFSTGETKSKDSKLHYAAKDGRDGTLMEAVTVQVWLDDDESTRVKVPGWCGVRSLHQ